jgi:hypothetical protein
MNWEAIGAIGEVAGAFGVIVTLVFLTSQIRQANKGHRSAAYQAYLERRSNWQKTIADPEVNATLIAGAFNPTSATEVQLQGMHQIMHLSMTFFEGAYHLWREGLLSDADWNSCSVMLSEFRATKGFQLWWPAVNDFFDPLYVEAVDELPATSTGLKRFLEAVEKSRELD